MLIILHQDDHVLAVDKPSGELVHRGWGRDEVTLVDRVRNHLGAATVHPIHRLDRATSGVVLFALSPEVARALGAQLEARQPRKRYLALVRGVPKEGSGLVDHPLPRRKDGPRVPSTSRYRVLASTPSEPRHTSLLEVEPLTGRPHQVRRHVKHLNHPIIGDSKYGKGKLNRAFRDGYGLHRMALHALELTVEHPHTGRPITLRAPLPDDLRGPLTRMGFELDALG